MSTNVDKKKNEPTTKDTILGFVLLAIIIYAVYSFFGSDDDAKSEPVTPSQKDTIHHQANLGIDISPFKDSLNKELTKFINDKFLIDEFTITHGEVNDVASHEFKDSGIGIIAVLDKNNQKIKSLTIVGGGGDRAVELIIITASVFSAATGIEFDNASDIVKSLLSEQPTDGSELKNKKIIKNNIQFSFVPIESMGYTFYVENAKQQNFIQKNDAANAYTITPDSLGSDVEWPLTIPEITIDCSRQSVLTGRYNGVTYSMTGSSKGVNQKENKGWNDIYEVTKPEPGITASNGTVYINTLFDLNGYAIDKCNQLGYWGGR